MENYFLDHNRDDDTELWRNTPPVCEMNYPAASSGVSSKALNAPRGGEYNPCSPMAELKQNKSNLLYPYIFPSGRQALSNTVLKAGLNRTNRVAIPRWSSSCVIGAVGKFATPIPIDEAIQYSIRVDAILLYEQWGWPLIPEVKSELLDKFENVIVILDRVDSSDIDNINRVQFYPETKQFDIISLSKILGLPGGGLSKYNGEYIPFKADVKEEELSKKLWRDVDNKEIAKELLHIHKENIGELHPELKKWLISNDLYHTLSMECNKRRENLKLFLKSSLSSKWNDWMFAAFEKNAGPGIVPLFIDDTEIKLKNSKLHIKHKYHIETEIYHFNWSGDPFSPNYKKCLAFPIHGIVEDVTSIISDLENL